MPRARQWCPGPGPLLTHLALRDPHSGWAMPPALPRALWLPRGLLPSSHRPASWASGCETAGRQPTRPLLNIPTHPYPLLKHVFLQEAFPACPSTS